MMIYPIKVFPIVLISIATLSAVAQEELPFWRQKNKLYKKVTEKRKILVSVKEETLLGKKNFRMLGVGVVNTDLEFAVARVSEYEKLPELSGTFKKVVHRKKERQLYLVLEALGYQARMLLEYKWKKISTDERQMDWKVVWGPLKGMVGNYKFRKVSPGKTEIALWAKFVPMDIPIPRFLLKFTLEVIAEKVARKMRGYIESEYRRRHK